MNAAALWLASRRAFQAAMSPDAGRPLATPMPTALPPGIDARQLQRAMRLAAGSIPRATLFKAPSATPYHLVAASVNSQNFDAFLRDVSAALAAGVERFCRLAVLVGVEVEGGRARGGRLAGPPLRPLAMRDAPARTTQQQRYSEAIVDAVAEAFDAWVRGARLAEVELGAPIALSSLDSAAASRLGAEPLAEAMKRNLADPRAYHQALLFHGLATGFEETFARWRSAARLTGLKVRRGRASMRPGGLVSPPSAAGLVRRAPVEDAPRIAGASAPAPSR